MSSDVTSPHQGSVCKLCSFLQLTDNKFPHRKLSVYSDFNTFVHGDKTDNECTMNQTVAHQNLILPYINTLTNNLHMKLTEKNGYSGF